MKVVPVEYQRALATRKPPAGGIALVAHTLAVGTAPVAPLPVDRPSSSRLVVAHG